MTICAQCKQPLSPDHKCSSYMKYKTDKQIKEEFEDKFNDVFWNEVATEEYFGDVDSKPFLSFILTHRQQDRDSLTQVVHCNGEYGQKHLNGDQLGYEGEKTSFRRSVYEPDWQEDWITVASKLCRVDARVPNRVDRIKALGNAIVPQVAMEIMKGIKSVS